MTEKTINAKFLKNTSDAGTGATYRKDAKHELPAGVFENYLAAGIVEEVPAAKPAATKAPASKPATTKDAAEAPST